MDPATHPEPFGQAIGHAPQRSAQLTSVVMAAAQVFARYRARRDLRTPFSCRAVPAHRGSASFDPNGIPPCSQPLGAPGELDGRIGEFSGDLIAPAGGTG